MINDEKAEKYMRKLRKYCEGHECDECIFWDTDDPKCKIENWPGYWGLPNET